MLWKTIRRILRKNFGTCIIIENGQPSFVIVSFQDYEKILDSQPAAGLVAVGEEEILERVNQEINSWQAKQVEENWPPADLPKEEELTVDDLPLV